MTTYNITTKFIDKLAFEAEIDEHKVRMDTTLENGGENSGPSPKKLLLGTLAACTGMDVVLILNKMKVEFSDFQIQTIANLSNEKPKVFTEIEIIYKLKTNADNFNKVEKAVLLSKETYCGIAAMLSKNCPLKFTISIQ